MQALCAICEAGVASLEVPGQALWDPEQPAMGFQHTQQLAQQLRPAPRVPGPCSPRLPLPVTQTPSSQARTGADNREARGVRDMAYVGSRARPAHRGCDAGLYVASIGDSSTMTVVRLGKDTWITLCILQAHTESCPAC